MHKTSYQGATVLKQIKQLEAVLASQQQFFTQTRKSNENSTKASQEVASLIAKHVKPFMEGELVRKMAKNVCPGK